MRPDYISHMTMLVLTGGLMYERDFQTAPPPGGDNVFKELPYAYWIGLFIVF
jgi:hypothetical protein